MGGRKASQLLDGGGEKKNTRMLCSVLYIYIFFPPHFAPPNNLRHEKDKRGSVQEK